MRKKNEIAYNYFLKIINYNPPVNLWLFEGIAVEQLWFSRIYYCWYYEPSQLK